MVELVGKGGSDAVVGGVAMGAVALGNMDFEHLTAEPPHGIRDNHLAGSGRG